MTDNLELLWRPQFLDALRMLARVSGTTAARGLPGPVLVGGGAVEFYTGSGVETGDIDLTTPVQPEPEEKLQKRGFVRPNGPGKSTRGWVHPDLGFGFEVVGNSPMSDTPDEIRVRLVQPIEDEPQVRMLSIEDIIADRMGQYASGTARDMLEQARRLLPLASNADREYLERRIRTETMGDYGVEDVASRTKLGRADRHGRIRPRARQIPCRLPGKDGQPARSPPQ